MPFGASQGEKFGTWSPLLAAALGHVPQGSLARPSRRTQSGATEHRRGPVINHRKRIGEFRRSSQRWAFRGQIGLTVCSSSFGKCEI
jgi:hypothetical protein